MRHSAKAVGWATARLERHPRNEREKKSKVSDGHPQLENRGIKEAVGWVALISYSGPTE